MLETEGEVKHSLPALRCVLVCQHQSCLRNGSAEVLAAFEAIDIPGVTVQGSGCQGQCSIGPTVRVTPDEVWYYRVKPSDVPLLVEHHLKGGEPVEAMLNPRIHARFYD
ncbi:MAG: (2Fe-2S) ferredoxin domain-containing protein [Actinomycetota bacterium]